MSLMTDMLRQSIANSGVSVRVGDSRNLLTEEEKYDRDTSYGQKVLDGLGRLADDVKSGKLLTDAVNNFNPLMLFPPAQAALALGKVAEYTNPGPVDFGGDKGVLGNVMEGYKWGSRVANAGFGQLVDSTAGTLGYGIHRVLPNSGMDNTIGAIARAVGNYGDAMQKANDPHIQNPDDSLLIDAANIAGEAAVSLPTSIGLAVAGAGLGGAAVKGGAAALRGLPQAASAVSKAAGWVDAAGNWVKSLPAVGRVAKNLGLPSPQNVVGGVTSGLLESTMEGYEAYRQYIDDAKRNGTYVEGETEATANRIADAVGGSNFALLAPVNTMEQMLLFGKGGKGVWKRLLGIAGTAGQEAFEEAAQQVIQNQQAAKEGYAGWDDYTSLESWKDPRVGHSALVGMTMGGGMSAVLGGGADTEDAPAANNAPTLTSGNAEIDDAIVSAAAKHGLPADLLFAVAQAESDFDQSSVSSTGAKGIMQLMPDTAAALGVDADDMVQNIEGGARYLKQQLDDFGGNVEMALAAYNAGPGAVEKYKGVPPYTETQNYVAKIMGILDGANMNPATEAEPTHSLLDDAEPFIGTRMVNGARGCVEAVTKIGAAGSDFLRAELEAGVVNMDRLVKDAGDRVIPFDPSKLEEGDVIVYGDDTDSQQHVVLYDGKGGYIGNSSDLKLVVHRNDYNAMGSLYPTKIIKSGGRYGGTVNISSVSGSVRPIDYSGLVVDAKNLQANVAAMKALIEGDKLTPAQKAAIIDAAEIIRDTPTEASTASPGEDALDYNAWQRLIDHKDIKGIFAKDPERVTRMVMRGEETQRKAQTVAAIENQQKVAQAQAIQAQVQAAAQAQPVANPAESAARLASVQQELSMPPMAQQEIAARLASYAQTTPHDVERVVIQNGLAHGDFSGIARALPAVYRAAAGRWMQQPQEQAQAQPQAQPQPQTQPTAMPTQQDMQVPDVQANDVAVPPSQEMTEQMPQQMQGQAQAVPTTEDLADIRQKLAALDAMMQGNPTYVEARRRGDWQTAAQEAAKAGHHDFARFYQMLHEKATGAPINITPYQNPAEKAAAEQGAVRPTPAPVPINHVDSMRPVDIQKSYGARRDFGRGLIEAMRTRNLTDVRALNDDLRDGEKRAIEHALKRIAQADAEDALLRGETAAQRANDNETIQAESRKKQDDDVQVESAQKQGKEKTANEGGLELADGYTTESGRPLSEADEKEFIIKPNGSRNFGEITKTISDAVMQQSGEKLEIGEIRLRVGNHSEGLIHAKAHEKQAQDAGYDSIENLIADVAENYDQIYMRAPVEAGQNPTYSLVKLGNKSKGVMNRVAPIYFELQADGGGNYYIVVSAMPKGDKTLAKQTKKDRLIYSSPGLDAATESNAGAVSASARNVGADSRGGSPTSDKSSGLVTSTIPSDVSESKQKRASNANGEGNSSTAATATAPMRTRRDGEDTLSSVSNIPSEQEKSKEKSVQAKSAPLTKQEQEALTGTSEEAKEAYRIVRDKLAKSKNKSVVRAAKVGATLFARHADIYAKAYSKATSKPYTALDYLQDKFGLDADGKEIDGSTNGFGQRKTPLSDAERKKMQLHIIQDTNPMNDDIHTGVRSTKDILSAKEAFETKVDENSFAYPDFTEADGRTALRRGYVEIYSSHPIVPGAFVTPSQMQAKDYAGSGRVYSKRVPLRDVAWLHSDEGQYAPVEQESFDQSAWHGTPHKFKKFDLGAIGTGEGAQVHGWGLYFAQQKSVGKGYREGLTGGKWRVSHGDEVYEFDYDTGDLIHEGTGSVMSHDDPETLAIEAFIGSNADKYGALNILENALEDKRRMFFPGEALDEEVERIEDAIELLENEWSRFDVEPSGSLFHVEIPDNDVLLDEQKPLEEQPKIVKLLDKYAEKIDDWSFTLGEAWDGMTGKEFYEYISDVLHGDKAASEYLNEAGIKGITYEGQRDGRCFVIFDDEAIEIIEEFNQRMNSMRKGSITPQASGRRIISLFEQADESTFLHEMGHMFLMDLEDLAAIDAASAEDLETVRDWATWQEGQAKEYEDTPWQKEFSEREKALLAAKKRGDVVEVRKLRREWEQERFARGFERYLETGKAPTSVLKRIFQKFKKFLQSIYQAFKGTGGKASPEVEAVMGRMIAEEEQGASSEFDGNPVQEKSAPIPADFSASKLKGAIGKTTSIATDSGEEIPVRYRLVDARSLVTSNSAKDFTKNPAYPKSLQPRDRERANMQQQIREMASHLRPEDLAASRSVNLGAPVVRADGVVLNGNGRAIAITRALLGNTFRDSTGKGYRAFLVEHAEEFGFKPETVQRMKAPMLVREVTGGLNAEQVKAVTTSTAGGSRLGASEQAKQDAEKITLEDLARYEENERGDLTTAANRDFVAGILYRVAGKNDVNAYTDAKGQVNADGIQRVKRALFQKAYGDDDLLSRMSESTNDDTRNITNGLTIAAPYIARANEKMARGTAHNYKLGETIADAVKRYNHLHGIGQSVENYLDQQAMFAEYEDSPEVREVLRVLNENRRSGKRIAQFVRRVGEIVEAQGNPNEISLMEGGEPLPLRDIIEIARRKFAEEEASRTALVHEAETLYQQAAERFPGIQDKEVASHVREAIQTTLDFGSLDGEIRAVAGNIYQDANGTTFSLFGNGGGTRSAVRNPSAREIQRQEIKAQKRGKIYGLGITRALVNDGAVSLVGQKAKSPAALAEIAQVLRHPGYEKFHIVYIKTNGAVVYHETVSARLPHRSVINAPEDEKGAVTAKDVLQNMHKRIEANLRKTGADKFYYIHNHPSGNPKPSTEDIQVTKQILDIKNRTNERAFAGHVVLDHNKYAVIDESLRVGEFRLKNKTPMTFEAPEKTHPALGITISHSNDTSRIAEMCAADAETVAFHLTPQLVVRGVQKIHDDFKKKSWDKQMRYLRHCARITGGTHIVLATSNRMLFEFGKADINNGRESGILDIVFMQDRRAIETGNNVGGSVMDRQNWFGLDMDDVESQRLLEPTRQYGVSLDTLFQFSRDNSKPGSMGRFRKLLVGLKIGEAAEKNLEVHRSNKEKQLVISASKLNQFMADKSLTEKNILKTEDLGGGKIRVTYMPQDFHNIHILDWLKSVRQLRKKNPFVKAIYDLGSRAMRLQEHLRNDGAKTVKEFHNLTKNKNDRELVTSILLEGDAAGKEYGVQELRAMGANANVIKAYQLVRRTMREWYKRVNDARMQVETRTKTLSKNDLADFKKNHWIADSDVLSVEEKGDGKVLLTWRGGKTYETKDKVMTKTELDTLLQDKDINVAHVHKLNDSYGVDNYSVDYVERIKPLGNLTGYMPHFFHEWMVYEKHKDPKTGEVRLTTIGSGRSMNDAVRLGNEIARKNSDKEYVVRPKGFDLNVENSVVIGDVDFQQMAAKLADETQMTLADANAFLRDNAGATMRARHRFFGNAMHRKGAKGFDTDITYILTHYLNTSARYIAMEQFKPRAITLYERWFGAFDADPKDATASYVKGLIKDINGDPRPLEKSVSELIMKTPIGKMISDAYGDRAALAVNGELSTWNAISKLGLGNFASMAVNFSQFINIGTAMNDYGYAAKGLKSALKPTAADMKILEESGVLDEINQAADNGGYTQRRFGRVGSVYGAIKRGGELSLLPFQYADVLMRKTAILGAYKQGVEKLGLSHEEAMERARDVNYDANFDYSAANAPLMIRAGSVVTQQMFQFQKYPIMQMEFMYNILKNGTRGQKVRFLLPYVLMCGIPGTIPFGAIFNQIFSFLFHLATGDDKDIGDEIKAEALRWAGKDPVKKAIVNASIYGVLAPVFGIDVSKRIGISGAFSGEFFGAQKPESVLDVLGMQLGGPMASTAVNMANQIHNGNPIEALKAFSPALGNMAQAMVGVSRTTRHRVKSRYETTYDRIIHALGFRSVDESNNSFITSYEFDRKDAETHAKQEAIMDYLDDPSEANRQRINALGIKDKAIEEARIQQERSATERAKGGRPKVESGKTSKRRTSHKRKEEKPKKETLFDTIGEEDEGM